MESIEKSSNTVPKILLRLLVVLLVIGTLFKIMHWPFANMTLTYGFIGLIVYLIFKLKVFTQANENRKNSKPLILVALFYLCIVTLSVGLLFKYFHWPYATILISTSAGFGLAWYLSDLFYLDEAEIKDYDELLF